MVLVVARVLICLVRAFQSFEVAVAACKFERAVGFASGTFPHARCPPSLAAKSRARWEFTSCGVE